MHWILIFFECLAPLIVSLLLLPLVVRARIQHAYATTFGTEQTKIKIPKTKEQIKKIITQDENKYPTEFRG